MPMGSSWRLGRRHPRQMLCVGRDDQPPLGYLFHDEFRRDTLAFGHAAYLGRDDPFACCLKLRHSHFSIPITDMVFALMAIISPMVCQPGHLFRPGRPSAMARVNGVDPGGPAEMSPIWLNRPLGYHDLVDLDAYQLLAVAGVQPIALAAFVFDDFDLGSAEPAEGLGDDLGPADNRRADVDRLAVAYQQDAVELTCS